VLQAYLGVAIGAEQEQLLLRRLPAQKAQQIERALTGPVQIVDDQAPGAGLGGPANQLRNADSQAQPSLLWLQCGRQLQPRQRLPQLGQELGQNRQHRPDLLIKQLGRHAAEIGL
jgi:hypothetical protein